MGSGGAGSRAGLQRKIAAGLVVVVGIVFIVVTFAYNLFSVGPAFEELIDDFRPVLTDEALGTARQDVATLGAAGEEFQTSAAPALSQQLGMSAEGFGAFVGRQFPAVATGMRALPQVVLAFNGLIGTLDSQRPLFESADAIPTTNLPATTVPWGFLIVGIITIAVGVFMWLSTRPGAITAVVLGVALVVGPILLSLPRKAADSDELNDNLKPIYTQQLIDQAGGALTTVGAMGEEMQNAMLPALAQQLGMQASDLQAFMGQNFPAIADALQTMPDSMGRFDGLVTIFSDNLDNYETLKPVAFTPIIWTLIIGGAVVLVLGAWGLMLGGRETAAT